MRCWIIFLGVIVSILQVTAQTQTGPIPLHANWTIQNGCTVDAKGETISTLAFRPKGWYPTTVPMTVVAALVHDKVLPDPYYGKNLRSFPGMSYRVGTIFSKQPMADDSPFKCPWWYRTQFRVPVSGRGKQVWLHFDGINYRARIWLNGHEIANPERVAGAYRRYEFDISQWLNFDKPNVLAVQVTAQTEKDLGINWVDWNPAPPDKNMGLWREVYLTTSGPVALRDPQVLTKLDTSTFGSADLTIQTELTNVSDKPVSGSLQGRIGKIHFRKPVELAPGEIRTVSVNPNEFNQLHIVKPRLWWPAQMGRPELYRLDLEFKIGAQTSDATSFNFGIREVTSELTREGYRLFRINGKKILIRGAGWSGDMLQRESPERQQQELRYVQDMGLNTVRLEGTLETDHFFDLADRMGILLMPGWCCCSFWEEWEKWTPADETIALESLRSQITRLRNHPSVFVWLNGSDNPPIPAVERDYLDVEKELNWPNPILSSATFKPDTVSGPTGVKMTGPYEYVPPIYWYTDTARHHGGAYGFNTETSPGPAPPPQQSIQKMMPEQDWWPIDDVWSFHSGTGKFQTLDLFNAAMDARYGKPSNLADYSQRAQIMAYDNERAMFEAYSANKYTATGVIQWMLNNAWPGIFWHLYDYYLLPAGGYFGTKKACEPVHVQYSYGNDSVAVVNSTYEPVRDAHVRVTVYNLDMTPMFTQEVAVSVDADSSVEAIRLPNLQGLSTTYFVRLELQDSARKLLSRNFYWLSTTPEKLDWAKSNYFVTPVIQHADLTELNALPEVRLRASVVGRREGTNEVLQLTLANPSKTLAFAVSLRVTDSKGEDILPVIFEDNYFPVLPGERRRVAIHYKPAGPHQEPATVEVDGWNVKAETLHVSSSAGAIRKPPAN